MTDTAQPSPGPEAQGAPARKPASRTGTILALVLIAAGVVSALVINHRRQYSSQFVQDPETPRTAHDLPIYGTVDPFTLTERGGKQVSLDDLKGRVWVAESFFTYCGSICPKMVRNFSQLHREFAGKDEPRWVSITVDPKRDTPEAITEYARMNQADTERWWFLRGEEEQLQELTHSLLLPYKIGDPAAHGSSFMLVDREGRIRGKYNGTMPWDSLEMQNLRRDLKLLLDEPRKP